MRGSRRFLRVVARSATATALVVAATVVGFSVSSKDGGRTVAALENATIGAGGEYHALTPNRILDTRDPNKDVDPRGRKPTATRNADATFDVPVVGRGGLPAFVDNNHDCADDNVLAVAVNITVVDPPAAGWLQAYGKGANAGTSSLINFKAHENVPNTALVRPGCDGQLTFRVYTDATPGSADIVVDIFGWFSSSSYSERGARLEPAGPGRIFDSREAAYGATPFTTGQQKFVQIRGATSYNPTIANIVPNSADAVGVLVNVTVVNNVAGSAPTYVSLLTSQVAAGEPETSNVNVKPGQVRANLAIVPISPDGGIWVYNRAGNAHVIIDVMGYFIANRDVNTTRGRVIPLVSPFRAFDTRQAAFSDQPLPPANAEDWSFQDFANDVKVAGSPVGAQLGLIGNLTAAALQRPSTWWTPVSSYVTAYPTPAGGGAATPPLISNLNLTEGETVPNMVVLSYGSDGTDPNQVRFYNRSGYLDYLLDVSAVILA